MTRFKTDNFRYKAKARDASTEVPVAIADIEAIEVVFIHQFSGTEWLKYKWPNTEGWLQMDATGDYPAVEITTTQAATAEEGQIILRQRIMFKDSRFEENFKSLTKQAKLMIIKK